MKADPAQPQRSRVYLDNAATSWPKPDAVYAAIDDSMRRLGAPAGRGSYAEAVEVDRAIDAARRRVAELIGARDARQIIFTAGGTDALNLAIHGLLQPGDHVVTTAIEHNSVLRPLGALADAGQASVTRVACDGAGRVDPDDVRRALERKTRLVVVSHASNVTGAIGPISEIAAIAHERGALVLVDAAQTAGHIPLDVGALGADLLAVSGHKGLLGPLGIGVLWLRQGVEQNLRPLRQGGTGTESERDRQPDDLPYKYEGGSLNAPGIIGLGAAAAWLLERRVESIRQHGQQLSDRLFSGLAETPGVRLYGPRQSTERVGLVSFTLDGYDPQEVAAILEGAFRVQTRAGLHCAPRLHEAIGTLRGGGTIRMSLGPFTTDVDVDVALATVREIAAAHATAPATAAAPTLE